MSLTTIQIQQLLPKPPRPLADGTGYDWREFDRWMQKIHQLLGTPVGQQFNVPSLLGPNFDEQLNLDFITDESLAIQLLRQIVDQLAIEVQSLTDQQNDVYKVRQQINDVYVELGMS